MVAKILEVKNEAACVTRALLENSENSFGF